MGKDEMEGGIMGDCNRIRERKEDNKCVFDGGVE